MKLKSLLRIVVLVSVFSVVVLGSSLFVSATGFVPVYGGHGGGHAFGNSGNSNIPTITEAAESVSYSIDIPSNPFFTLNSFRRVWLYPDSLSSDPSTGSRSLSFEVNNLFTLRFHSNAFLQNSYLNGFFRIPFDPSVHFGNPYNSLFENSSYVYECVMEPIVTDSYRAELVSYGGNYYILFSFVDFLYPVTGSVPFYDLLSFNVSLHLNVLFNPPIGITTSSLLDCYVIYDAFPNPSSTETSILCNYTATVQPLWSDAVIAALDNSSSITSIRNAISSISSNLSDIAQDSGLISSSWQDVSDVAYYVSIISGNVSNLLTWFGSTYDFDDLMTLVTAMNGWVRSLYQEFQYWEGQRYNYDDLIQYLDDLLSVVQTLDTSVNVNVNLDPQINVIVTDLNLKNLDIKDTEDDLNVFIDAYWGLVAISFATTLAIPDTSDFNDPAAFWTSQIVAFKDSIAPFDIIIQLCLALGLVITVIGAVNKFTVIGK